jgi:hypothetical protein
MMIPKNWLIVGMGRLHLSGGGWPWFALEIMGGKLRMRQAGALGSKTS